jgi:hypothetical protein
VAQDVLIKDILAAPKELWHCPGLSPARLPAIVENNPAVAIELLLRLKDVTSSELFAS